MSDLSATIHGLGDLLHGRTDFNGFLAGEVKLYEDNMASLTPPIRAAAETMAHSLKVGASGLVGVGMTAIGPIIAESSDAQATLVLNLLQKMGVPTAGPMSEVEHAGLVMALNGLKAGLDKMGLQLTAQPPLVQVQAAPSPPPYSAGFAMSAGNSAAPVDGAN